MATERRAEVTWQGDLMHGNGRIENVTSGAFSGLAVSWPSRAEEPGGKTTPEELVDELERSYKDAQERMSDPSVYNDRREAAAAGRKLKELEAPFRLAQEWRQTRTDLDAASADGDLRELIPELEARLGDLELPLRDALAPSDPD